KRRLPVVAGCLHHHPGHAQLTQPIGQDQQRAGHRGVGAHLLQPPARFAPPGTRTQHTSSALPISSAATRPTISSVSLVSSSTRPPARRRANSRAARRSRKGQAESDPRAQGNTEGPIARLPASDLDPASPTKEQRRQRATRPIFSPERASPQGDQGLRLDLQQRATVSPS